MDMTTVPKPWGHEHWYANTPNYLAKILHINAGHTLSLQYHQHKDETSHLLTGRALLTQGTTTRTIEPGTTWHNPPRLIHTIQAITTCTVLEVSTPHPDDVIRISDNYGRANAHPPMLST